MSKTKLAKQVNYKWFKLFIFSVLLTYILLFYFLFKLDLRLDFASFYASALAYYQHSDPYKILIGTFLSADAKLPINLNPPFFLEIIQLLALLDYRVAVIVWSLIIFILGLIGAYFGFKVSVSPAFFKRYWPFLLFIYLAFYPTIASTVIAQVGGLLMFFIFVGYYFYLQKKDYVAGILWGIIISLKLFPALLFIFACQQKRYRVLGVMFITFLIAYLIPILTYGNHIYYVYFTILKRVLWYGDLWNASIYGFLFRFLINPQDRNPSLWLFYLLYWTIFVGALVWYIKKLNYLQKFDNQRPFCLTLVMMLVLSPLGWLYYFPLLIMPLINLFKALNKEKLANKFYIYLWLIALFLANFPLGYSSTQDITLTYFCRTIGYSIYFYSLLLLAFLLSKPTFVNRNNSFTTNPIEKNYLSFPAMLILSFGLFVPMLTFVIHLIYYLVEKI
ncbi:glycosyltransferase family 87 protein [Legionella sp. D16C41]|uniref:glycosyltransferase family 87 protein n=1 Tax=Legionella sp. D16C41 TaxID=3402688 RepID=UPI003AF54ED7